MGLTNGSVGLKAVDYGLVIKKQSPNDKVIALAGNPNVGKSTVFNELTGLKQHTGNWPGKTVTNAQGYCTYKNQGFVMVDIPGSYSLMAHSAEEEVARDFICFGNADAVVVVCDATCLERNLNLVLQTIEITDKVIVLVNLLDEAERKNIKLNLPLLSEKLGVPVIGAAARQKKGLDQLLKCMSGIENLKSKPYAINYSEYTTECINILAPALAPLCEGKVNTRWLALRLLDCDDTLKKSLTEYLGFDITENENVKKSLDRVKEYLSITNKSLEFIRDDIVSGLVNSAESICKDVVVYKNKQYNEKDRKIDKILTNKWTGFPIMFALLAVIFWITITGANYPSELISRALFWVQDRLLDFAIWINTPEWLYSLLILGIYRVVAWVVSVMLPPMAIFFPLFTLLEDLGYLPRVAFNLDKLFKKCCACGKQALTTCMGFGCNAAGIVGCRIIDSPRERLIAMLTNNFIPCNGRFPTMIAIISMFFIGGAAIPLQSISSALLLALIIVLAISMSLIISKILSMTLLKGVPSSFTLELPPYRKPQIGKVITRSIFDRTLFVLGRALAVAAPAGLIIWVMANLTIGGTTLLSHCAGFLDPFAKLMGLDGVILMAFILGIPANEIVIPIIIMAYMAQGSLIEFDNLSALKQLFVDNGWTSVTAISTILFSLMHWPCSTTLITIKKESQSIKWTIAAFLIPTITGIIVCMVFANTARLFLN